MSFELTSIQYDSDIKLNRLNKNIQATTSPNAVSSQWQSVPYLIGIQLNIYGRNQDDVLQVLEQIVPTFQPEYTVRVIGFEAPGVATSVPFTLDSINMTDDYDGAYENRRVIIYTLDFTARVRFSGPPTTQKVIRFIEIAMHGTGTNVTSTDYITSISAISTTSEYVHVGVSSQADTSSQYEVISSIDTFGFAGGFVPPGKTYVTNPYLSTGSTITNTNFTDKQSPY